MSWPIKKHAGNCYSDLTRLCEREKFKLILLFWILKRKEDKVNDNISFEICRLWQHVQRRQRGHGLHGHHRHHGYQHSRATAALGLLRHLCTVYDFVFWAFHLNFVTWFLVVLGKEVTKISCNSLFTFFTEQGNTGKKGTHGNEILQSTYFCYFDSFFEKRSYENM